MAIKVKLVRSFSGRTQDQKDAVIGLGLFKVSSERVPKDTPQVRGMVNKIAHLLEISEVKGDAPARKRSKGFPQSAAKKAAAAKKEG